MTYFFVDGASKLNHIKTLDRPAGAGVYVDYRRYVEPARVPENLQERFNAAAGYPCSFSCSGWRPVRSIPGFPAANNRAEIEAVVVALEIIVRNSRTIDRPITIVSDSKFTLDVVQKWMVGWRRRKFRKANGEVVANVDRVRRLSELLIAARRLNILWRHINSHQPEPADKSSEAWRLWHGNEMADKLANHAARLSRLPESGYDPDDDDEECEHGECETECAQCKAAVGVNTAAQQLKNVQL
jgi:ribonuclease HI